MAISINEIKSADWSFKTSTFGEVVQGYDDINQSINIILKTPKGSDVFRPLFGAEITKYIDQPINQGGPQMVREILEALAIWETRIEVTSVNYTVENSTINFEIRWILVENRQTGVANIAIQNAPLPEVQLTAPPAPFNLSALTVGFDSVALNWNYDLAKTGSVFQIFRSFESGPFVFVGSAYNSFSFTDSGLESGNYDYKVRAAKGTEFGEFSNIAIAEILLFFTFQTNWNTATDGAFNASLIGGTKTWIFGDDTVTTGGASPNYSGSYLDGNLKTVAVTSPDFSAITSIVFSSDKIAGEFDLSVFSGINGLLQFQNNNITSFELDRTTPKTVTNFTISDISLNEADIINMNDFQVTHGNLGIGIGNNRFDKFIAGNGATGLSASSSIVGESVRSIDLTNCNIISSLTINSNAGYSHRLEELIFKPAGNSGTTLDCLNTKLVNLDFSNCPFFDYDVRNNFVSTSLSLATEPHVITILFAATIPNLLSVNLGGAIINNTTTLIVFGNSGLNVSIVNSIYSQLANAYDGVSDLSALSINTTGNDSPTGGLSNADVVILTDANATVLI